MTPALLQAMRDLAPAPPADEPQVWRMLQPECEPRPTLNQSGYACDGQTHQGACWRVPDEETTP